MRKMSSSSALDHKDAANRPYVKPSALLHTSLVSSSFDFVDDPRPISEGLRHAHIAVNEDRGASGEGTCIDDVVAIWTATFVCGIEPADEFVMSVDSTVPSRFGFCAPMDI
ncbi:hypothetical protein CCUS01_15291 [Colletotrichum cuscutae]|uniref:Uncharacterized protein n=1 Tax=Colletotrichum cuscutae TaxID=1209917 RepID=A0AAI9Y837_9PEZI|nr:hypothetical protein CCUS01_15291 [Colletotrichum cuscutae]